MFQVIKSILLISCSIMGMMLIATPYATTGFVLAFGCFLLFALDVASNFINQGDNMKKKNLNIYQVPIKQIYKTKQYWSDWLKYKLPIPKKITPYKLKNILGGYK